MNAPMTNLNDTSSSGPLTDADMKYDPYSGYFRRGAPMSFEPVAYKAAEVTKTIDDDDGQPISRFGAFGALPIGLPLVIAAWAVITALAALGWWLW